MRGLAPSCCVEAAHQGWGKKEGRSLNPVPFGQGLATAWPQEAGCLGMRPVWGLSKEGEDLGPAASSLGGGGLIPPCAVLG